MPETSERWARIKELFDAAVDLNPDSRAALLDRECGEDQALREEIEDLIKSDALTAGFIEKPALRVPRDLFPDRIADRLAGQQFGSYKLIREIGRGGLGTVYLAARADDQYQKEVAIKVIRRGLDTDDIVRRFRNERQILAQLDHPNIARLIDGGTTQEGLPYFVMEHVNGEPIIAYCQANALSAIDRLKLFRKVCAAVTYAHQNLVIHRDLKPSNILVTREGVPKLLDFGIAKLLTATDELFTETTPALRIMTPEYASPEQVKGEKITTTSDVYSLGVILYELLTGQRPYRVTTRNRDEIARAITEQEPERPSTAVSRTMTGNPKSELRNPKLLRGDLDNIVMMAMRKEPTRRYTSAAQLSDDIRRYFDGLPVIARKDTLWYRTGKFVRRHKVGVAAAALIASSLIVGIIATFWQARRATQQRDRAERRFADVRKLSNALLFDIAPKIERLEGSTEARKSLVQRALEYLDSLANESAENSALQSELAAAYEKVGELQGAPRKPNLNEFAGAIASYEKARNIRKRLLETNPDNWNDRERLAIDLSSLSSIRLWINDMGGSLEDARSASAAYEILLTKRPSSPELQVAAAESDLNLANAYYYNDQLAQVYSPLKKALAVLESLRQLDPDNPEILRLLGRGHTILSMTLSWDGKQKEGEDEMAKAFAIYEPLLEKHPQDSVIRQGLLNACIQSSQLFEDSDPERSFRLLLKARELAERSIAVDAVNIQARQNLAKVDSGLGVIALVLGKTEEAVAYLQQSSLAFSELDRSDSNHRSYKYDEGRVLSYLGQAKYRDHEPDQALAAYAKAIAIFEEIIRADPGNNSSARKMSTVYQCIGDVHRDLANGASEDERRGQRQAAKESYQRALNILVQLQQKKALAEYDLKYLDELRAELSKLE